VRASCFSERSNLDAADPTASASYNQAKGEIMKQMFLRLERATTALSMYFACAMLAMAAGLGVFQILTRFVLEKPAEWTEVLIRFSLIWMVFMGIPMAFRQGAMVSVDVLYRWASDRHKRVLDAVVMLASLLLIAVIIIVGWDYSQRGRVQTIIGLEDYSMFWAYIAMPVGGLFAVLGIVGNFLDPKRLELETAQ
jgi:TRAP-type C4-dicarboxylate transport system permease small subunit